MWHRFACFTTVSGAVGLWLDRTQKLLWPTKKRDPSKREQAMVGSWES